MPRANLKAKDEVYACAPWTGDGDTAQGLLNVGSGLWRETANKKEHEQDFVLARGTLDLRF
jgi:hypothetical protein